MKLKFKNPQLLKTALTHRSALNENPKLNQSNERLEFLGDAVLEITVSDFLYHKFPDKPEGQLTSLRAKIVQTQTLAVAAKKLKLGEKLIMSKGEKKSQGNQKASLLANTFEAVIGAIYLDQGLSVTKKFISQNLLIHIDSIVKNQKIIDYKSKIQENWQKHFQTTPVYKMVKSSGPDHLKTFKVKVYLKKQAIATGTGKSKQQAEQQAAKFALRIKA